MAQFNSGYSSSEILSMQRDAAERVREMQRRAQQKLYQSNTQQMGGPNLMTARQSVPSQHNGGSSGGIPAYSVPPPRQEPPLSHQTPPQSAPPPFSFGNSIQGILDQFHLDQDRIVLLLLFLVLMREESDPMLLLALAYIFL